ncbi:MAG: two component sensor histidine kinase [Candidatus Scalindua rubra]|uniref:histidine kinase n=1 Tax=Candidatus Scalindua rubra TaxID=1872076 RepID=A0A1E3X5D0_9BACT|nr:MAG: two component sensor histidine kinase [Candidatus Scalindua rubra]
MLLKKLLGEILADMGFTKQHLAKALKIQRKICRDKALPERLQRNKLISEARLATDTTPMLGQILIDMGVATKEQLDQAIKKQEKMIEVYKLLKSEKLGAVAEECSIINSNLNIAEVLESIMKYANKVTNSVASTLMLLDEETGELVLSVPTGPKSDELTDYRLPPGKGIAGWVAANEQHALVPDARKDSRSYGKVDEISGFETKSILCVPLKAKSKLIGVLEVINKADDTSFTEEDAMLLNIFANQAAIAIENARFYGELKEKTEEEKKLLKKFAESEKLRALGLMASGMAHDFNNMLTIMLGTIELIEIEKDKDVILKKMHVIKKAAIDSAHIIKKIQKFTKTEEEDIQFKPVEINDLVRESIEITTPIWKDDLQAEGISIEIVDTLLEEELIINGNDSDLREAIINLIFNSVDAMPEGGKINIATYMKGENVCLEISDNGVGMTEETKNRIFDPFFTTKGVSHSGLGMSVLYGIIKRHNGVVEIKTEPGEGTSFIIGLSKRREMIEKRDEKVLPVVEVEKAKVLVIDDKPEIAMLLSDILSSQGHQTHVFNSGKDGIEAFKKGDYDMLVTDLGMPDISGWEVISVAKQINPRVLIGMVTGWDIAVDEAKQKGVDFIIHKPFRPNQIKQAVTNAFKSKA